MPLNKVPQRCKVIVLRKAVDQTGPYKFDAVLEERDVPSLKDGQVLVKIEAAGFNHREVWIRKGLYPGITIGSVYGADGAGTVVASSDENDPLLSKKVFLVPSRGWDSDPHGPESKFGVIGGGSSPPIGTFTEFVAVGRKYIIPTPDHLSSEEVAVWPVAGVTAWRAAIINAGADKGRNILITGAGGGVALLAVQLSVVKGANVFVTSGSDERIKKLLPLGVKGGVNYKHEDWPVQLGTLLQKEGNGLLDAVIDSAGRDIVEKTSKLLKPGGKIVAYGIDAGGKLSFSMREILRNIQFRGSTMGSQKDLEDATNFITEKKLVPVISHTIDGLESIEKGFEILEKGEQFGKVVVKIRPSQAARL
ncbi:NAD(P)-binding protein [Thelephora ganbajun]|uniref:NAD(P)-binding protein n=1 Tax=Thelephora ganbajun TaxID=370292 RepID=A0ACB6ZPI6_THEGA|nr:NAD(P)-binding protein [Thelephora ganbajun]